LILALRKDLGTPAGRYVIIQALVRSLPGELGIQIRSWLLGRHFKRAGPGLRLAAGIRLFGVNKLAVGANCRIGLNNLIQANGGVEMGDNVVLGPGVNIESVNHVYVDPYRPITEQGYVRKPIYIGSNVWIGTNVFVMPGAHICDGVVISAGSVVGGKVVEPYAVIAGNPARKIGSRLPPGRDTTITPETVERVNAATITLPFP
jgi:acetyltransferase-like isoleucine patch superfamily enzyme